MDLSRLLMISKIPKTTSPKFFMHNLDDIESSEPLEAIRSLSDFSKRICLIDWIETRGQDFKTFVGAKRFIGG